MEFKETIPAPIRPSSMLVRRSVATDDSSPMCRLRRISYPGIQMVRAMCLCLIATHELRGALA